MGVIGNYQMKNFKGAAHARNIFSLIYLLIIIAIIRYKNLSKDTIEMIKFKEAKKGLWAFFK